MTTYYLNLAKRNAYKVIEQITLLYLIYQQDKNKAEYANLEVKSAFVELYFYLLKLTKKETDKYFNHLPIYSNIYHVSAKWAKNSEHLHFKTLKNLNESAYCYVHVVNDDVYLYKLTNQLFELIITQWFYACLTFEPKITKSYYFKYKNSNLDSIIKTKEPNLIKPLNVNAYFRQRRSQSLKDKKKNNS